MPDGDRTPVLVGAGTAHQREADPSRAAEPLALMITALERAAEDAGARALLARADSIRAPRGFWDYGDPCRLIAERFAAGGARTEVAEIGVLQTTLIGGAAADIAHGRADVVLITGGEARYRALRAQLAGVEAPLTVQAGVVPDRILRPAAEIVSAPELAQGLALPVMQYAMIDNALRHADGVSLAAHRDEIATLWARMSRVAEGNPDAWTRAALDPATIRDPGAGNRMLAFPYTKLHTSQWNVDQAAGLILCSRATARALGVPRARWVFPLAVADANHMLPLSARRVLHQSPGFACAGERAGARAGLQLPAVRHLELYSCFPAAVRIQQRALGLPPDRPVTVTGGMAFAGGPLNNFVLQALARLAAILRRDPGATGLLTAVSGMLTKQGVSLWSTEPPPHGFCFDDVSAEAARRTEAVEVVGAADGAATVATYTVLYGDAGPERAIVLCDLPDRRRALATVEDPASAQALTQEEGCGRGIRLLGDGRAAFA
jgi:acetyl-CoA C-acetyltransferase